jgi:hypothetical protein
MVGLNEYPKIDGNILDANNVNKYHKGIATGTLTVVTTTTTAGVDYVDIPIPAGLLTEKDLIVIELIGTPSNIALLARLSLNDVTSVGNLLASTDICTANDPYFARFVVYQDKVTNDIMSAHKVSNDGGGDVYVGAGSLDSGDANVITTAFTLQLSMWNASTSSGASTHKYWVYAVSIP